MRWPVVVHLLTGRGQYPGWLLGGWLGASGPVLAWALALVSGSWVLARFGPAAEGLPLRTLFPAGQQFRLLVALTTAAGCLLAALRTPERSVGWLLVPFLGLNAWFVWGERQALSGWWFSVRRAMGRR